MSQPSETATTQTFQFNKKKIIKDQQLKHKKIIETKKIITQKTQNKNPIFALAKLKAEPK